MKAVALYSNENFPRQAVEALRALGYDVLTSFDAGNANKSIPDDEVLKYATTNERAVLTLNRRDFIELHDLSQAHGGIIVCKVDADYGRLAANVHDQIREEDSLSGKLIRVTRANQPVAKARALTSPPKHG